MLLKKKIPLKYVFGKIKIELFIILSYTTMYEVFHHHFLDIKTDIPIAIPSIIGTIISLLLAFKSNQAYDRWWEARIIWGAITNDSRTLVRQLISFYRAPDFSTDASNFIEKMARRQAAWCHSLGQALRDDDALPSVKNLLSKEEFKYIQKHKHIPNAILILHGKDLKRALENDKINTYQQIEIDKTITRLCDSMGKCERIKSTIFPTTYSFYIHMTIYLFIMLLPFGLTPLLGWFSIPLITIIAVAFFLIEKMAIHLQDPFENKPTDTPVTTISNNIEKNLMQMVNEHTNEYTNETPYFTLSKKQSEKENGVFYIL
jgi:putative membrane protein